MKILILVLILSKGLLANDNFFNQNDKQGHIAISAMTASISSLIYSKNGYSERTSFWLGLATSMLVGVAKEVYDQNNGGKFDMKDILADGIGASLGSFVVFKANF